MPTPNTVVCQACNQDVTKLFLAAPTTRDNAHLPLLAATEPEPVAETRKPEPVPETSRPDPFLFVDDTEIAARYGITKSGVKTWRTRNPETFPPPFKTFGQKHVYYWPEVAAFHDQLEAEREPVHGD